MDSQLRNIILNATGACDLFKVGSIQSLWSGYGSIDRYGLVGSEVNSVVIKHVGYNNKATARANGIPITLTNANCAYIKSKLPGINIGLTVVVTIVVSRIVWLWNILTMRP